MQSDKNRNLVAGICYALGFVTAIFILFTEDRDKFIRFNAYQSLYATGGLFLLNIVGGYILGTIGISVQLINTASVAIWLLIVTLCVLGFYNAWHGRIIKLPVVGGIAERKTRDSI